MDRHINSVHEGNRVTCNICGKSYADKRRVIEHMKIRHEGIKPIKNYKCDLCGKEFCKKFDLTRHSSTFACQKIECEKCHAKIRSQNKKTHLKYCGRAKRKCHLCEKSFFQSKLLAEHIQTVHEGKQNITRREYLPGRDTDLT